MNETNNEYIKTKENVLINLDQIYSIIMECYQKFMEEDEFNFNRQIIIDNKKINIYIYVKLHYFYIQANDGPIKIIKLPPLSINFKKNNIIINIYTLNQLENYIKFFKYELAKLKINNTIKNINEFYKLDFKYSTAELIEEENDEQLYINKFKFKKIKYSKIKKLKFTEMPIYFKDYLKYNITNDYKYFEFYMTNKRAEFIHNISLELENNNLKLITGIHGIGKSITLFMLKFLFFPKIFVYLNLDLIKTKKVEEWKKIIKCEFSYIFDSGEDFVKIFSDNTIKIR